MYADTWQSPSPLCTQEAGKLLYTCVRRNPAKSYRPGGGGVRGRQEPATSQSQVCPSGRPHAREYWRYLEGQRVRIFSNGIDQQEED